LSWCLIVYAVCISSKGGKISKYFKCLSKCLFYWLITFMVMPVSSLLSSASSSTMLICRVFDFLLKIKSNVFNQLFKNFKLSRYLWRILKIIELQSVISIFVIKLSVSKGNLNCPCWSSPKDYLRWGNVHVNPNWTGPMKKACIPSILIKLLNFFLWNLTSIVIFNIDANLLRIIEIGHRGGDPFFRQRILGGHSNCPRSYWMAPSQKVMIRWKKSPFFRSFAEFFFRKS
jgi:hypothetical protein